MHLGALEGIDCSYLHGEEAQKCTVVLYVIRFHSMSIYEVPRLGTRENWGY